MTAVKPRIALIAPRDHSRAALAEYLERSGYDVYVADELTVPSGFGALVMISAPDVSKESLLAEVHSWIKLTKSQRVIVVTSRPTALKDLVAVHGHRLSVLAAPAFGWELVDTLRTVDPHHPRGA